MTEQQQYWTQEDTEAVTTETEPEVTTEEPEVVKAEPPAMKLYQIGYWHGLPNFGCPHCPFKIVKGGTLAIQAHIETRHPDAWLQEVK